ncbi:calcineurin-like metallo-phosphoesterase super family protein [Striga asiatica]|uniref:Calcineurin-like metallo-phosphoesterase super family protein n=1 Tax=Striga asiatica TaxID=4170 RepID=A0A5A7Q686_STRAF|nr:calcineurin-like metallo-phosphoesterase super family protein [Striga asiatica]
MKGAQKLPRQKYMVSCKFCHQKGHNQRGCEWKKLAESGIADGAFEMETQHEEMTQGDDFPLLTQNDDSQPQNDNSQTQNDDFPQRKLILCLFHGRHDDLQLCLGHIQYGSSPSLQVQLQIQHFGDLFQLLTGLFYATNRGLFVSILHTSEGPTKRQSFWAQSKYLLPGLVGVHELSLCIAAYIALSIGQPQKLSNGEVSSKGRLIDVYFISVDGGFRPLVEQTLLLQQMAKGQRIYKAHFVIDVSELGQSSPLLLNATMFPEFQSIPWYTSGSFGGQNGTYFLKKIEIPYGTLDIIALDAILFQDHSSVCANDQIQWLTRILKESDSEWKVIFGECNILKMENGSPFEPLWSILLQYGVDAYISAKNCVKIWSSGVNSIDRGPYFTAVNQNVVLKEDKTDGFFLHRVSSLEMDTFSVGLTGEIEHELSINERGRAAM